MYTFRMRCDEDQNLSLNDGAVRIFLNTKGKNKDEVSPELIELLRYMENSTEETAESCKNPEIMKMHQRVEKIRSSEEVNTKYMKEWEERKRAEEKAREEGKKEGKTETLMESIVNLMSSLKLSSEQAMDALKIPEEDRAMYLAELNK